MRLMSIEDAATELQISIRSMRQLVADGKIAVYRIGPGGGRVRFSQEDLESYQRSCRIFGLPVPRRHAASRRRVKRSV